MKLRYRKIRRWISYNWLVLKYQYQGSSLEEAKHVAKSVVYGWNSVRYGNE